MSYPLRRRELFAPGYPWNGFGQFLEKSSVELESFFSAVVNPFTARASGIEPPHYV